MAQGQYSLSDIQQPTAGAGQYKLADAQPAQKAGFLSDVGDTLKQYWNNINPVSQAQGAAQAVQHPVQAVQDYGQQTGELFNKAKDSFKKGEYAEGVRHSLSYFLNGIPGVGAMLDRAGDKAGSGDYKGAIADTAALATQIAAGKAIPAATEALTEPGVVPTPGDVGASIKSAVKAGAPDVAKGAGKMAVGAATGAAMSELPGEVGHVMAGAGAAVGGYAGARQIGRGISKGFKAGVQTMGERLTPPEPSITPEVAPVASVPEPPAPPPPNPLDLKAQEFGYKDIASAPEGERPIIEHLLKRDGLRGAPPPQQAPTPSAPAPGPLPGPIDIGAPQRSLQPVESVPRETPEMVMKPGTEAPPEAPAPPAAPAPPRSAVNFEPKPLPPAEPPPPGPQLYGPFKQPDGSFKMVPQEEIPAQLAQSKAMEAAASAPAKPPAAFVDTETSGLQIPQLIANRAAKAQRFIEHLGGTQNLPRTSAEWAQVAKDLGEKVPSAATQQQIMNGLLQRMRQGTEVAKSVSTVPEHLAKNPKAMKLALDLYNEMQK